MSPNASVRRNVPVFGPTMVCRCATPRERPVSACPRSGALPPRGAARRGARTVCSWSPAACDGQHGGRGGAWVQEGLAAGATADGTAVWRCAVPTAHLAPPSVAIWGRSGPSERGAQLTVNWALHGKSLSRGAGSGGRSWDVGSWSWVVVVGRWSLVVGRAQWVVGGRRSSVVDEVVGRRSSWVVGPGRSSVVGRRRGRRSLVVGGLVVSRWSWIVGRGSWDVGSWSWVVVVGWSWVVGRASWVVGHRQSSTRSSVVGRRSWIVLIGFMFSIFVLCVTLL